jgi:hypothetical protein
MFLQNLFQRLIALYVRLDVYIYTAAPRIWYLIHQLRETSTERLSAAQRVTSAPLADQLARIHEASALITGAPTTAQMTALLIVVIIQAACVSLAMRASRQHAVTGHQRR